MVRTIGGAPATVDGLACAAAVPGAAFAAGVVFAAAGAALAAAGVVFAAAGEAFGAAFAAGDGLAAAGEAFGAAAPADGSGLGFALTGDGEGSARWRSESLATSVGGTPGGVGAAPLPGTAPRRGRSLAGPQAVTISSSRAHAARDIAA
jgi:hypothetical protein